jgi:hypothetical protein
MMVNCISNTGEVLPPMSRDPAQGVDVTTIFPVSIGRPYAVFAMTNFLGDRVVLYPGRRWKPVANMGAVSAFRGGRRQAPPELANWVFPIQS